MRPRPVVQSDGSKGLVQSLAHRPEVLRRVEEAIEAGDKEAAGSALVSAQPELMRGVTKGIYHKNTAARKMSRLSARVKSIA